MDIKYPIVKTVIHSGQKYIPLVDGSKTHFHFQTWKLGKERVLVDDSKKIGKKEPMVLVIGHKFKLEVWETILKKMSVGEVASFHIKKELVYSYPFVAKTLRELGQEINTVKHSCTMTLHTEGIGYKDLDDLISNPCDLEFIIELLKVERSDEYEKEVWQLNVKERLDLIPVLREKGNKLYGERNYSEAEETYSHAIGICEQLMISCTYYAAVNITDKIQLTETININTSTRTISLVDTSLERERKTDEEWINLNKIKLPLLLNYTQCKLVSGDYYAVIEHCSTVLEYEKDNEKALYRRAKAHVGAWNPEEAEKDFIRLKQLNPSMKSMVDKELEVIKNLRREKENLDKEALKNMFDNEYEM